MVLTSTETPRFSSKSALSSRRYKSGVRSMSDSRYCANPHQQKTVSASRVTYSTIHTIQHPAAPALERLLYNGTGGICVIQRAPQSRWVDSHQLGDLVLRQS